MIVLAAPFVFGSRSACACAVCFGDPSNSQTHGMNAAIFTLLGVTGLVLGAIVLFVFRMLYRTPPPDFDADAEIDP